MTYVYNHRKHETLEAHDFRCGSTPRVVIECERDKAVWVWPMTGEVFGNHAPDEDVDGDGRRFTLDLRFPGQRYDSMSGLFYNYFRDYDPEVGRYVQSDPIGLAGG